MGNYFEVITSPTGKTKCKICNESIKFGEQRVDANLGSGYYSSHYHVKCFFTRYCKTIRQIEKVYHDR